MMVLFTYDDGEKIATVSYTDDYGFIAAGDHEILDRISYEVREPRAAVQPLNSGTIPVVQLPPSFPCVSCGWPDKATHDQNSVGCREFV